MRRVSHYFQRVQNEVKGVLSHFFSQPRDHRRADLDQGLAFARRQQPRGGVDHVEPRRHHGSGRIGEERILRRGVN